MQEKNDWQDRAEEEMRRADAARREGNEGMARVCARRAAGILLGEFFERRNLPDPGPGAYDRIQYLSGHPDIPGDVREALSHLMIRVTPDHTLPVDVDLLAETRWLSRVLLDEEI